ncbi:hypothetical protein ACTXGL_04600 [Psychrobacter sp. T6-6]|uniref:hypothetical protein n=1 Tax=Psychrobacter sp. T6-6 TaxID=3457452 RepID=UPI003FD3A3DB
MITLGNIKTIAFKIHEMEKPFIVMDIIVNSVNISYQDNNYYAFPLVNNIKKEIELITNGEFHLNKSLINTPLSKLHDIFYETETGVYDSSNERGNFLFYDLSTNKSLFYVYQEDGCLIFFGKFFDGNNIITSKIRKSEFLATLLKLLHTVEPYAAPRNI